MKNIICFGEVLWDVYPDKIEIGGAPFNVYHRLHSFGLDVNFISSVGKDELGNNVINHFKKNNLSTNFLNVDKNYQTGQVLVTLKSGEPNYDILENVAWDYIPFKNDYLKDYNNFDCGPQGLDVLFPDFLTDSPTVWNILKMFNTLSPQNAGCAAYNKIYS